MAPHDPQQHAAAGGYPITPEMLATLHQMQTAAAPEQVPGAHVHMPAPAGGAAAPAAPEQDVMMSLSTQEQMANLAAHMGQHPEHHKPDQVSLSIICTLDNVAHVQQASLLPPCHRRLFGV